MTYKLGSLFDGSGGFPLAGSLCGIEPRWASEVEPYPIAVTRERLPKMKHLGDISKINGAEIEPVDIITFGSPCFPAGTLVLTKEGYKEIENIHVGELVYTHAGNWKPVSAVGYKYSPTVKLKGNHYGIIATPNHPFYSAEHNRTWNGNGYDTELKNVGEWTPAEKMAGKRWSVPVQITGLDIPKIEKQNHKQNDPPVIDDRLMYVVGRWLGDGWLRDGQRSGRKTGQTFGQIFICANKEKSPYLQQILNDVFTGSSAVQFFQERTVNKFRINNQPLCKWLKENFGEKAHGKTLPAWALCMNEEMRKALLFGYLDSDGYKTGENSFKATTVSKKLAHSLCLLGESLGYSFTVHYANVPSKKVIEGRTVNQKPQYQVVLRGTERKTGIIKDTHKWYKCRTVEPYSDKQTVYNITVEDDHSYIVEGFIVHNCQDLSVAGKRAGLKHEANGDEETTRSGLFMEAVRIIKEMRTATNGKYPRFALWENVPGAFSSNKGEDFRIVCEELIKIVEPSALMPEVPKNGWPYSDSYIGDGWSLAYRVFDAQYWGVPQRRRRIHLVADFRGERAREVLFERDGVRGYFTKSGTPWQTAAADTEGSTGATDREGENEGIGFDAYRHHGWRQSEICGTLTAGQNDGIRGDKPLVVMPYTLKIRSGCEGGGKGALIQEDKRATLATNNDQYLFQPIYAVDQGGGKSSCNVQEGKAPTLCTTHGGEPAVAIPIHDMATRHAGKRGDKSDGKGKGIERDVVAVPPRYIVRRLTPTECARLQGFADWWGHIEKKTDLTDEEYSFWLEARNTHAAINGKPVKEYTKAQMLTWYNKLYTDSAEYKMWGNGIALPPALYCMQGVIDALVGKTSENYDFITAEPANGRQENNQNIVCMATQQGGAEIRTDNKAPTLTAAAGMSGNNQPVICYQIEDAVEHSEDEATDLSDAPEEIKTEIIKNDELLQENKTTKEIKEDETMETPANIENKGTENNTTFSAVEQLRQLANERKALANLNTENPRFTNDVRALEYAISVLKAVGL